MSLRHGLLGLLAERPGSGWDLLKRFESSLAFVWPATQSQLYTELGKMADDQLVEVTATGARNRKEYAITDGGRQELEHWLLEVEPEGSRRNDALLRVFFLWSVEPAAARRYFEQQADAFRRFHALLAAVRDSVPWDDGEPDRFGRIALENGLRTTQAHEDWARWAADRVEGPSPAVRADRRGRPRRGATGGSPEGS